MPNSYLPQLNGLLTTDADNNYVFHPTNNTVYSVVNTPGTNTGPFQITVGEHRQLGDVYAATGLRTDGFWLLALKRTALGNLFSCDTNVTPTPCGAFYQNRQQQHHDRRAAGQPAGIDIERASSEQLLFLVSIGHAAQRDPAGCVVDRRRESRRSCPNLTDHLAKQRHVQLHADFEQRSCV